MQLRRVYIVFCSNTILNKYKFLIVSAGVYIYVHLLRWDLKPLSLKYKTNL